MRKRLSTIAILLPILLAAGCGKDHALPRFASPKPLPPQVAQLLRETVAVKTLPAAFKDQKELQKAWNELRDFYQKRNFQPVWFNSRGVRSQAEELIQAIPALGQDGLNVRRYQPQRLEALVQEAKKIKSFDDPESQRRLVDLDAELTYTYLSLAAHLASGRLQPEKLRVEWYTKPRNVDLDARLGQALEADSPGEIVKILRSLTPPYPDYQRLPKALAEYRAIAARGGWAPVPPGPVLKTGARGLRVAALRARLAATGDLPASAAAPARPSPQGAQPAAAPPPGSDLYAAAVASAVSHFQRRHGLEVTGKVDEDTLAELNVPVADRIRQLQVNMERWRWLPATFGDRYILVNVPEFRLDLVEAGRTALTMRVIVGKEQSRTPAFSDKMTFIELNPSWNVPDSIAKAEILPKLASDPGYLARHNMEVVHEGGAERIRQRPGDDNPLGKIKFMFPNEFDIYLHDTPADHLFDKAERDFSHGCIRLEKPIELAAYLLKDDPKWTPEAIQAAIDSGENQTINLPRPIAVHILYWTAWVEPDGTVAFRKDIYGHDDELEQALAKEPPVWLDLDLMRGDQRAAK
jgi:murein L,D-transpeptidase YcbB/YkuD